MGNTKPRKCVLLAALLGGIFLAGAVLVSAEQEQTFTGAISSTHCGSRHFALVSGRVATEAQQRDAAKCIVDCVNSGNAGYALVLGDTVYTLEGDKAQFEKLAGQKVEVNGSLNGTTIRVSKITPAT